jgi:hypothetical protein
MMVADEVVVKITLLTSNFLGWRRKQRWQTSINFSRKSTMIKLGNVNPNITKVASLEWTQCVIFPKNVHFFRIKVPIFENNSRSLYMVSKRVLKSESLKPSPQKWVLETKSWKASPQRRVLKSESSKVSPQKRVLKCESSKASSRKRVLESESSKVSPLV